jgi:class 3 adenylate cyclase/TolB-like protein
MMPSRPGDLDALTLVWRAVVVVDVVESMRLMQSHEIEVIRRWRHFVRTVREVILPSCQGRLVKSLGDGMLLEFDTVPQAVQAALAMQTRISEQDESGNDDNADQWSLQLRMGAHLAEVVVDDLDIYGQGVNLAARLSSLAEPDQFIVSADFAERVVTGLDAELDDLGDCWVKHLDAPVHAFRLMPMSRISRMSPSLFPSRRNDDSPVERIRAAEIDERPASVAVLHFNQGHGPELSGVVGELIADTLSTRLSVAQSVRVISRLSCQSLAGRQLALAEVGSSLGADYVVSGSFSGSSSQVTVMVELAETRHGNVLWGTRTVTSLDELLRADDDFSAEVAQDIIREIATSELRRATTQPLPQLHGYTLQQAATQLMHRSSRREFDHARVMLDHLLGRYPRASSPHAWLAKWHVLNVTKGYTTATTELAARALDHTRRALASHPDCSLALAVQGFVHLHVQRELDLAQDQLAQALTVNPNEALAWLFLSVVLGFRGDGDTAWQAAQRALQLSPLDPQKHFFESLASSAALCARRHEDSIQLAKQSLRINRSHLPTLRVLTIAQVETGQLDDARITARRILEVAPDFSVASYAASAPRGAEEGRRRYAEALRSIGLPEH